jgi:hypothetical protein
MLVVPALAVPTFVFPTLGVPVFVRPLVVAPSFAAVFAATFASLVARRFHNRSFTST